jgi:hypothetical protein
LRLRQGGTECPFWKKPGSASHVFSKKNKIKTYAVGILFWSVGRHKTRFACGSMLRFFSVAQTCGSASHMFVQKDVQFRPAGGEMSFQVRDRVSPVKIRSYAVGILFWSVGRHKTRFACGSMVHVFSVAQKNSRCEFFCATDRACSALPEPALSVVEWGDIPRQT